MMDADIRWDSASGNVEIACKSKTSPSDVTITTGVSGTEDSATGQNAAQTREFGQKIGPFEEIDPKSIESVIAAKTPKEGEPYQSPFIYMEDARIQHKRSTFPPLVMTISPEQGQYLVYTVTNNGTVSATSSVFRMPTVAYPQRESFQRITVAPGETLVRAFKVTKDENPLTYELRFNFIPDIDNNLLTPQGVDTDMTVSLEQYS